MHLQIELIFHTFNENHLVSLQNIKSYLIETVGIPSQFIEMKETQFGCIFNVLFRDVDAAEKFLVHYYAITANKIKARMSTLIFRLALCQDYQMFAAIKNYIFQKLSVSFSFYGDIQ